MDVFKTKLPYNNKNNFEVEIKDLDLHYVSDPNLNNIARPFTTDNNLKSKNTLEKLYLKAREDISYRQYIEAENKLIEIISKDPYHIEARSNLGELFYRKGEYIKGLEIINKGLSVDTYNPSLNYIAGIIYKATHDNLNAKETFGWAARSIKYRSNAFSQMGDIFLKEKKYGKEGMRKIQQAAGKRKSHAEIGKIKDKYEKGKKAEGSCGYGIDGKVGDEPAGPHLIKKKKIDTAIVLNFNRRVNEAKVEKSLNHLHACVNRKLLGKRKWKHNNNRVKFYAFREEGANQTHIN